MTKIVNTTRAPQGVHTKDGLVKLRPGESADVELDEFLAKRAARIRGLVVTGYTPEEKSLTVGDMNTMMSDVGEFEKLQRVLAATKEELTTIAAERDQLKSDLADRDADLAKANSDIGERDNTIAELSAKIAASEAQQADPPAPAEQVIEGLEVKHKGGGSYSVFDKDGNELVAKLTKEQSEEFEKLDDAGKTQWVAAATGNASE